MKIMKILTVEVYYYNLILLMLFFTFRFFNHQIQFSYQT